MDNIMLTDSINIVFIVIFFTELFKMVLNKDFQVGNSVIYRMFVLISTTVLLYFTDDVEIIEFIDYINFFIHSGILTFTAIGFYDVVVHDKLKEILGKFNME